MPTAWQSVDSVSVQLFSQPRAQARPVAASRRRCFGGANVKGSVPRPEDESNTDVHYTTARELLSNQVGGDAGVQIGLKRIVNECE